MNHCQICERAIKDKHGIIAHHGYKRPGGGWQTASCMGARYSCYEQSRDLIPVAINQIEKYVEVKQLHLAEVKAGKIAVPAFNNKLMQPSDPLYFIRQREYISKIESEIRMALRDRDRLRNRFDNWIYAYKT